MDCKKQKKCPKGKLSPTERPCFNCGQPGHLARNCPKKQAGPNTGGGGRERGAGRGFEIGQDPLHAPHHVPGGSR